MRRADAGIGPMSLVKWAFIGLIALPAAELLALVMVASLIGWLRAAALFIGTSVVGVLLRKSGRADLARFRAAFAQQGMRAVHLDTPGVAAIIGGILLTFPGFITDLVGAALFLPAIRRWTAARFATPARDGRQGR